MRRGEDGEEVVTSDPTWIRCLVRKGALGGVGAGNLDTDAALFP